MTKTLSLTRADKEAPDANNIRMNDLNAVWFVQTVQQSYHSHFKPINLHHFIFDFPCIVVTQEGYQLSVEHAEIRPLSLSTPFALASSCTRPVP